MNNIKLSILITFCNQNKYIKEALDSCINQKINFNYEILVGLDNGDNEAQKIIQAYIHDNKNIKLFEINNSKLEITNIEKASKNRLNLLKNASGEYICFLDGDDFYCNNNRHQIMIDFLDENPNYVAAFHDFIQYNEQTKQYSELKKITDNAQEFNPKDYFYVNKQFSCFMYRNIFKNCTLNDLNIDIINDTSLTLYFLRYGKFYYIPQIMFAYRIGIESIFSSKEKVIQNLYALLCGEVNQKYLPQYEKELCKKYKKLLHNIFHKRKNIDKCDKNELSKIKNFAKKQKCYFTFNILNYKNLNLFQKIKFNTKMLLFIFFRKNLNINKKRNKNLLYFNFRSNFGDQLNLYILQRLLNYNIKHSKIKKSNLVAIGSMLGIALSRKRYKKIIGKMKIWGTGFIEKQNLDQENFKKNVEVLALRGVHTKKRVEKILNKKINCPLGDPGLLASKLLINMPEKQYQVGILPHYVDKNSSFLNNIKLDNYTIIDITKNPIYILNEIAKCEVILSSAMHGLIVADSLNIPNQWIKLSELLYGRDYKFKDYYSIFNYEPTPIDLRNEIITQETIEKIKINYKNLNFKQTIKEVNEKLLKCGKNI